jgi:type II restriction/modification system DNA methylase subunit YeeA
MTPEEFIKRWRDSTLKERSASQSHFNDLCDLLGVEKPTDVDQKGDWYCFERGASKTAGGEGWADVWKRNHFAWEYKGKRKDLTAAYAQLQQYAVALENPPLLVVSDMDRIIVHTNWTNTVSEVHTIQLEDLRDAGKRNLLRWVFTDPERLKPLKTIDALTREAADKFAQLAIQLHAKGNDPHQVAHFVNRLVFCMFTEDINLLPRQLFSQILDKAFHRPALAQGLLEQLFAAMKTGGLFGIDQIEWFNGGLFDDAAALSLTRDEVRTIGEAAALDWSDIDPSIFGTLFERGLDPAKRSQLGAHYTDPEKIMMIVRPVIVEPLLQEWEAVKGAITKPRTSDKRKRELLGGFLERLRQFRVLDPACGSGNFLYLALLSLKDLEHRVNLEAEAMGFGRQFPSVGPEVARGIEINPYAAELARVTVWIGEIQWMRKNGFDVDRRPVLKPLNNIECRDALLNPDGTEAEWPVAEATIGNPPFLGDKRMLSVLGDDYVNTLRKTYASRIPGGADFVMFWFEKAWRRIAAGEQSRAGFVATQSIRRGASSDILKQIASGGRIYDAWDDEEWTVDGADVRVSLICFDKDSHGLIRLDGSPVPAIHADLSVGVDLGQAKPIASNTLAFIGTQKSGPFEIEGDLARLWLQMPLNPNGRPNADVLRPWANGNDITGRSAGKWIIDFGPHMTLDDASLYEVPFTHVETHVRPLREPLRRENHRKYWWIHGESRPGMRRALRGLKRSIVTPRVAKHRLFVWLDEAVLPDSRLVVIARDDDTTFGVLHSRFHELWSLRLGGWHGVGNDPQYTPSLGFETFPFPEGLTLNVLPTDYADNLRAQAIATAAKRLNELRENWLNPPDLVRREPEVVEGYPDRIVPINESAAADLKKRTLTELYNAQPAWLVNAHKALDAAVAQAYGWPVDISDEEILSRLLALNLARSAPAKAAKPKRKSPARVISSSVQTSHRAQR